MSWPPGLITGGRGTLARAFARSCVIRGIPYQLLTRSDLDIADKGITAGQLVLGPGDTVVSGDADEEGPSSNIEVVPRDVHVPEVGRGCIVVGPARFSVVTRAVVNAEMRPAIRIRGIGGLVPADAKTAAGRVDKDSKPSAGWLVVQSNGVAKRIGEWALTVGLGETGEGGAAVFGH